ncbi:MAG: AAA family ATPase, partial [Candidatus Omnitrophota bacterium]|nr:AAA family ATPase [Candidatus Omnitrophota bacterium]
MPASGANHNHNNQNGDWIELSKLGPLEVTKYDTVKVPAIYATPAGLRVATAFKIDGIEIPAPLSPRFPLVPANVKNLQDMWNDLRLPSRNNLLLYGDSGAAKTTLIRYLGEIYKEYLKRKARQISDLELRKKALGRAEAFRVRVIPFHENLRKSDITERRHYGEAGEEKTGWTLSDVMDGWESGDWIVLSEINRSNEDVWAEFNEPLEAKEKALHQRVVRFNKNARTIATINPSKGEEKGIYEGKVLPGEFLNRFTNKIRINYLPPVEEFVVLKYYGPDVQDSIITGLISVANDIRKDYAQAHGLAPFPVTTRALIRMVKHLEMFPNDKTRISSLFWIKGYYLDDKIHGPAPRKLIDNLLEAAGFKDLPRPPLDKSRIETEKVGNVTQQYLVIGDVRYPLGRGGEYVPGTMIEEVQQNLIDFEWILKDMLLKENIILIAEAAAGKNTIEKYLGHRINYNVLIVGMGGGTKVSDLQTYRSLGEEEAGKTGDTATLALTALTDTLWDWLVVLDEANKAEPGVLVSLNDPLQDKKIRLPNGKELSITGIVFVNMNPNRPPYEVNDVSFEFMDRFCIHQIHSLFQKLTAQEKKADPKRQDRPEQAKELLCSKYPQVDKEFIEDVVNAFCAIHPLFSEGELFEPVSMRNAETAVEKGLQNPDSPVNLIDLLLECYDPMNKGGVENITKALKKFNRQVIPCSEELRRLKNEWEQDKANEGKALALVETYNKLSKQEVSLSILEEMAKLIPERSWLYNLKAARLQKEAGNNAEANKSLAEAFKAGTLARMNNGKEYEIIKVAEAKFDKGKLNLSLEAKNSANSQGALIISLDPKGTEKFISSGERSYKLQFSDKENELLVYELPQMKILVEPDTEDKYLDKGLSLIQINTHKFARIANAQNILDYVKSNPLSDKAKRNIMAVVKAVSKAELEDNPGLYKNLEEILEAIRKQNSGSTQPPSPSSLLGRLKQKIEGAVKPQPEDVVSEEE